MCGNLPCLNAEDFQILNVMRHECADGFKSKTEILRLVVMIQFDDIRSYIDFNVPGLFGVMEGACLVQKTMI